MHKKWATKRDVTTRSRDLYAETSIHRRANESRHRRDVHNRCCIQANETWAASGTGHQGKIHTFGEAESKSAGKHSPLSDAICDPPNKHYRPACRSFSVAGPSTAPLATTTP